MIFLVFNAKRVFPQYLQETLGDFVQSVYEFEEDCEVRFTLLTSIKANLICKWLLVLLVAWFRGSEPGHQISMLWESFVRSTPPKRHPEILKPTKKT